VVDIKHILKQSGLKVTPSRLALLEVFTKEHGPFSPEDIFKKIKKNTCDLVTVYRCLTVFEDKKLIHRCLWGDGISRYEFRGNKSTHHHHILCRGCKHVFPIEDCLLEDIEKKLEKKGFFQITHFLEFVGTCKNCLP
jgi:Fur family ferric uptake transcriptional regulator